ncbi:MAG: 23S rRNA (adenine(2503)-C(2))-methyltransferase RlmN [Clostridiales bacterium]|nr:23S rRNA (adenine(2503)-C(2))-methyltransferase RlmN [Clostridiales bacterium]
MLSDLTFNELQMYVEKLGLPKFRASQVFDGIVKGKSLDEITNLSKEIKEKIAQDYPQYKIIKEFTSNDGTQKFIIEFGDGKIVECVLMKYKYGNTICVSTQVGCRMGCKFCASTLNGLERNLSAGEILGQVLLVNRKLGGNAKERKITNIVMMGSGEPLDNFDNACKFIELVSDEKGINISQRNISLSTCGLVDKIKLLQEKQYNITLTISLHASLDEKRREVMPIANKWSIKEIIDSCREYFDKTGRRIYIEYTLIKGVNNSEEDAKRLALLLKGLMCHINVIPLNSVKERNLLGVARSDAYKFVEKLESLGLSATVRRTMGEDIEGACGQLRNKILKEKKDDRTGC